MTIRNVRGSYVQFSSPMKSILYSLLTIVAAAVPGTLLSWWAANALGLTGISLGLTTAFFAMVLSVAIFSGLVAAGRALKLVR